MRSEIEAKIAEIYAKTQDAPSEDLHLFGGIAGIKLFNFLYLEKKNISEDPKFQNDLQLLAENSLSYSYPTFCSGYAGIQWFFTFLRQKNALTDEDIALLCFRDGELQAISLDMLAMGNYDFLHGAIGIAYYLLYSGGGSSAYYSRFFEIARSLIGTSVKKDSIPFFDFVKGRVIPEQTNLGLAHGLPAVLKFCIQCVRQHICTEESSALAAHIIDYLSAHTNKDTGHSYFGYVVSSEEVAGSPSRLAWCYGDPGVAYVLYQAGLMFNDRKLVAFALGVLEHSTKRRTLEEAGIFDAGFCHGTAGVAHIYHKIWRYTSLPVFKEACEHWMRKTLDLGIRHDGIAGYKSFDPTNGLYSNSYGMLEGAAGIGLVLLSYFTGDCDWDYCLLLND